MDIPVISGDRFDNIEAIPALIDVPTASVDPVDELLDVSKPIATPIDVPADSSDPNYATTYIPEAPESISAPIDVTEVLDVPTNSPNDVLFAADSDPTGAPPAAPDVCCSVSDGRPGIMIISC